MNDPGQSLDDWLTLTEAAARTGHTREALRQRVRRKKLPATMGNDKVLRVHARDLADLPPLDESTDDPGHVQDATVGVALDSMAATLAVLRTDLVQARTALDTALANRLADHGRAERAEERAKAEADRAAAAEARLARVEAELAEVRTLWIVRIIRAWRQRGESM